REDAHHSHADCQRSRREDADGAGADRQGADRAGPDRSHPVTSTIPMPDRARVMEFVAMVVSGDHVGAIANFYHEDATMQENRNPPRRGRDILMAHEARALSRIKRMHTHPAEVILVDGDNVAIRWTFDRISHD